MISVESRYDDGVVMEAVVEKFVKYFKSIFHHNTWYFVYFVTCGYTVVQRSKQIEIEEEVGDTYLPPVFQAN